MFEYAVDPVRGLWRMRDMYSTRLTPKHYADEAALMAADAVMAFPFNWYRTDGTPDNSNRAIAEVSARIAEKRKLALYGQSDQAEIWRSMNITVAAEMIVNPREGRQVGTAWQAQWAADQIGKGKRVIILAHAAHALRAAAMARLYGLIPIIPEECKEIPYDPLGGQSYASSEEAFRKSELGLLGARMKSVIAVLFGMFPVPGAHYEFQVGEGKLPKRVRTTSSSLVTA